MSQPAAQPTSPHELPDPLLSVVRPLSLAEQVIRDEVDAAFAMARRVMERNGITPEGITFEFVAHAVDRLWNQENNLNGAHASACALVSRYVDRLREFFGDPRLKDAPAAPQPTVSDEDVRFVARLAGDMAMAQLRATGNLQISGANAVRQAIGLMQDARRQLLQIQSGEITISDPAEGGRDAA